MSLEIVNETSTFPLPPLAKGLPILGNALQMQKDPLRYLVELYHQLGSVFRIRVLNREITVLAGMEANRFAAKEGAKLFSNHDVFIGLALGLGTANNITVLDGEEHSYHRKVAQSGYSRSQLAAAMPLACEVMEKFANDTAVNSSFDVFAVLQRLITYQLGRVATHYPADEYFEDLLTFQRYMMNVHMVKAWPEFVLKFPQYKRVEARTRNLGRKVVQFHQENPPSEQRPRDLIDDYLQAHQENPERMPMDAVNAAAIGPYVAGQDTVASSIAFIVYAILKHPEVLQRLQPELDALFAGGVPTAQALKNATTLYKTVVEGMRRYPAAPFMIYYSNSDFEFAGYQIKAGSQIYVPQTLTHFLPEYYPEPYQFNIDRPKPPAGTYAPYGIGPHTCLGAGMAEVQIMLTVAALFYHLELALELGDYELDMAVIPLPHPNKLKVKVLRKRH